MPYAVLVDHPVWVIHPAVKGSMVECRSVFLSVGGVECVGQAHVLPACVIFHFSDSPAVLRSDHREYQFFILVRSEVKWHEIVNFGFCQSHMYCLGEVAVNEHIDACVIVCFLNRE